MFSSSHRKRSAIAGSLSLLLTGLFVARIVPAGTDQTDSSTHILGTAEGEAVNPDNKSNEKIDSGSSIVQEYVDSTNPEYLHNQEILGELKSWIIDQPDVSSSGYIDQINNAEDRSVTLLWAGEDDLLAKVIHRAEELGISVSVQQRSMSRTELEAAVDYIWSIAPQIAEQGFVIESISAINLDHDGIDLGGHFDRRKASTSKLQSELDALQSEFGTAVNFVENSSGTAAATRSNDTSPFYAGGYMLNPSTGRVCSTSFALSVSGTTYIPTARHCRGPYTARTGSASYGTNWWDNSVGGSLLSARGAGRMFDGAWNDASGYSKPVRGFWNASLGDSVCTSGGNSGVHCWLTVDATAVSISDGYGTFNTFRATHQNSGSIAVIEGDSGGPVLVPLSDGGVGAVGMIQGFYGTVMTGASCGSVHDLGNNRCTRAVLFTPYSSIASGFGAALLVQ